MALNKTMTFDLELKPGGIPPIVHASQGDIGRMFKANIYWDGSAATSYISGATVNLRGRKPDKTVFDYTATLAGSMVTFETTEQMTIISGPVECELVFSQGGDVIASANFVLMVEDSPYDPNALSESDIPGIVDLIEDTIGGDVRDEVDALIEAHPELMLQDNSVTTPKIAAGAVTEGKIASNAVTTGKLATGAVTSAKVDTSFLKTIENAYVTPEQFGAVGDGVTDDTTAIQTAINTADYILLSAKAYKITNTLILNGGKRFIGAGNVSTVILADCDAIEITGRKNEIGHFQITSFTPNSYTGIKASGSSMNMQNIHDLTINKFQTGVYLNVIIWDCEFKLLRFNECVCAMQIMQPCSVTTFQNIHTSYCSRALYLTSGRPVFLSCNFGIVSVPQYGFIRCNGDVSPLFIGCNFEADTDVAEGAEVIFNFGSGRYKFEKCSFNFANASNIVAFGNHLANTKAITFEECTCTPSTTFFAWSRQYPAIANNLIGVIRFICCADDFPKPTNLPDAKYSCWVDVTGSGVANLISTSTIPTNVQPGTVALYAPTKKLYVYNGTAWKLITSAD